MSLVIAIGEVLSLQPMYLSSNTPEMQRRGRLIRQEIPHEIGEVRGPLAKAMGIDVTDLLIEGRDGTGLKAEVPWVRFAYRERSPSATTGWYVVWLHRRDGAGVYLTLAHGSTTFVSGALVARSDIELSSLMEWGRRALGSELASQTRLITKIDLASKAPLALAYEKSSLAAFYYPAVALPTDSEAISDMLLLATLLGRLYEAERLGQTPLSVSPDIVDAEKATTAIAKPSRNTGQGFNLTSTERIAIERHAMSIVTAHFEAKGYAVKDVSRNEPYDLLATRGKESLIIEVKGTTSSPSSILLTKNEVRLHQTCYPRNALAIVYGITLSKGAAPQAFGGTLSVTQPWLLESDRLTALSFSYLISG